MTPSWLVSIGEKCELYVVQIVMNDIPLEQEFIRVGYRKEELVRLNRVQCHQKVSFLSDIVGVLGSSLDERYLKVHTRGKLVIYKLSKERSLPSDFHLWNQEIQHMVLAARLQVRIRQFLHKGYKWWD